MITGYGLVTSQGRGTRPAWEALVAARAAGADWSPDDEPPAFFCAPVLEDYRPHPGIPRNLTHFLDRGSVLALDAALQAVDHAGLAREADSRRFAVVDGLPYRAPGQPTVFVPYGHMVARALGVRGPVSIHAGAEASGMAAIIAATRLIASGHVDVVIAGAAQGLQRPVLDHLTSQHMAAGHAARPFDAGHDGMVPAEGAAYVVIESAEHAQNRAAPELARIAGVGEVFDSAAEPLELPGAPEHGRALQAALGDAGYLQNQIDLVVSCADGRPTADFAEGYALKRTFGRHAYYASVTTATAGLGFALAANGPISLVLALEAMARQETFPIAGFETAEQDVELAYVRAQRAEALETVMVTSIGLGGTCAAVVLDRS